MTKTNKEWAKVYSQFYTLVLLLFLLINTIELGD